MSNTKTTKRALLSSVVAMLLCISMLIGTTFAWFTDTVTSGVNIITAGNLDIELEYSKTGADNDWHTVEAADQLFNDVTLWEPGATSVVYLRLSNLGTLDLKYRFAMNIVRETQGTSVENDAPFKLSDYLKFSFIEGNTVYATREEARTAAGTGTVLSAQNSEGRAHDEVGTMNAGAADRYFALVVFMPETVGNAANYKTGTTPPQIELGLELTATQLTSESDSFDNQYDGGANVGGDLMQSASAVVTAPAVDETLEIILNNNAPVSNEKSTTLTMASIPETLAGKEVKFSATTYNASATQNEPNFRIATGNTTEVAALKLELTVDGQNANNIDNTTDRTITTYIEPGLTGVTVTYVPETGSPVAIAADKVDYDPATGKLVFTTTHFSDYVVTAQALTETDGVYEIYTASDLFAFARLVNVNGNTFAGKTVRLMADIDLKGEAWTPIGINADDEKKFQGTFDGNDKTISNLVVNTASDAQYRATGFFGALNGTAKNFTIDGATITGLSAPNNAGNTDNGIAVVAGSIYTSGSIEGVTVKNATVSGNRYVGGISGYTYGSVKNCTVENVQVTATPDNMMRGSYDNGDKAGGVVGAFWHENAYEISGNTAKNVTVKAYRDMGGIVGYANGSVTNNTVDGLTLIQDYSLIAKPRTTVEAIIGRHDGFEVDASNTAVDVTTQILVSTEKQLSEAVKPTYSGNATIMLQNDIVLTGNLTISRDVTLMGDGNFTISNYPVYVGANNNVTFQNVNFATPDNTSHNASSVYASGLEGKVTFNGCTFTNPQWECIQITPKDGAEIIVTDCTFIVDGNGTYAKENGTKVERLLHIENTDASGKYTAVITNNRFVGVDLCRNAVIDVDNIEAFANVTCGENTFAKHDNTPVSTLADGMIYVNINGRYTAAYVATDTYAQFTQTPAAALQH